METIEISREEAREYASFKRQKRLKEVGDILLKMECDLTQLSDEETVKEVRKIKDGGFGFIRVNPLQIKLVKSIGLHLPIVCQTEEEHSDLKTKLVAMRQAFKLGADETVMTLNGSKSSKNELRKLKRAARGRRVTFRLGSLKALQKEVVAPLSVEAKGESGKSALLNEGRGEKVACASLTVELSERESLRDLLLQGADRVVTREYERVREELLSEANRPEVFEKSLDEGGFL